MASPQIIATDGGMRPIDTEGFYDVAAQGDVGPAPMLQWVKISDLVVDDSYQRPIYGGGRDNVRKIAEAFCWAKFAPLIVAPVAGGRFAVIDGQHRATAAALRGFDTVPAQVVIADQTAQAAAFKAVNGQVTRMSRLALQHAALTAGDPEAVELESVCAAAGVVLLRYPKPVAALKPGETLALGAIANTLAAYGRDATITALTCVTETENNNRPGVLCAAVIKALAMVLAANRGWRDAGERLLKAFDEIDLEMELEEARYQRRPKGVAIHEVLADRLKATLSELMAGEAA